jgi:hypothetical protein
MTIGGAILIAAILFLIDRNHVWPQVWSGLKRMLKVTAKICSVLILIGTVVWIGTILYDKQQAAREERERIEAKRAEVAQKDKAIADRRAQLLPLQKDLCGEKTIIVFGAYPESGEVACAPTSDSATVYKDSLFVSTSGCEELRNKFPEFTCHLAPIVPTEKPRYPYNPWEVVSKEPVAAPARHVVARGDVEITTKISGSLTCGHVKAGEEAVLLEEQGGEVKVRNSKGQVGWAYASLFEVKD